MKWILDPASYTCKEHGNDLTTEVWREATSSPVIVTGGGGGADAAGADALDAPLDSPLGPFLVVVTCPGKPGKDGAEPKPHKVSCQGVVLDG